LDNDALQPTTAQMSGHSLQIAVLPQF